LVELSIYFTREFGKGRNQKQAKPPPSFRTRRIFIDRFRRKYSEFILQQNLSRLDEGLKADELEYYLQLTTHYFLITEH
jgi:hypothetical protein